jgi:intracellular septation protein
MHTNKKSPGWLKPAVEYGPIAVFFITYYAADLMTATVAIMATTAVALVLSFVIERRIPVMPLITAIIIGVFGGLTLYLQDETFIKMKPTIIETLFGVALLGGMACGKLFLKSLMGSVWKMTDKGWRVLTVRFSLFFFCVAILNEAVWRTQSTDFWVNFKVFGLTGLTMAFVMTQLGLLKKFEAPE